MGMHNGEYYLSNSEMNDWFLLCPLIWKAKYIDRLPALTEDGPEITAKTYGVLFETMAIGSGVGGRTISEVQLAKIEKSEYYPRLVSQAKDCREFFKVIGGKILARQPYLYVEIRDAQGNSLKLCGGLDLLMGFPNEPGRNNLIIDTKMTGDNDNEFGKWQFGNVDRINPQQAIHYTIVHKANYDKDADFQYFVFDKSPSMKQKIINVVVSEMAVALHLEKCVTVYNEITFALAMDDWGYKNNYDNCRYCPVPCNQRRILPDIIELNAN